MVEPYVPPPFGGGLEPLAQGPVPPQMKPDRTSGRTEMLAEASRLVSGDRNAQYGEPHQDFQRTADMMSAMGFRAPGDKTLEAHHVALLLACVKMSRLVWSPGKRDSWVDLAGYAACGYEAHELTHDDRPNP
jgi:hypothetical protein